MDQATWDGLSAAERDAARDESALSPQLVGLEGWRVEVETTWGSTRRFIVGRSTGWIPIHLEVSRRDSSGGGAADREYKSVRKLYKVRG
jgi:hypothetical protein